MKRIVLTPLLFVFVLLSTASLTAQENYPGFRTFAQKYYLGGFEGFQEDILKSVVYPQSDRNAEITGAQRVGIVVVPGTGLESVVALPPLVSPTIAAEAVRVVELTRGSWRMNGSTATGSSVLLALVFTIEGIEEVPGSVVIEAPADPSLPMNFTTSENVRIIEGRIRKLTRKEKYGEAIDKLDGLLERFPEREAYREQRKTLLMLLEQKNFSPANDS